MYFTAYLKVKGENRALQEELLRLKVEKQGEPTEYRTETKGKKIPRRRQREIVPAKINKQHSADTEKKEYLYDEKSQQFVKYFALLDEFHRKNNAVFTSQFHPIMNRFLASNSVEDEAVRNNAVLEFNREVQKLFNQLYEEQQKVNSVSHSLRSFSSDKMDELLDKLESAVKRSTDDASEVLRFMASPKAWADQSLVVPLQKTEKSGKMVLSCLNAVRSRMKMELN